MKLDPSNTELLAQKHRLLGDAVAETKKKLETLKTAAEQANDALANGAITQEQYDVLQREIAEEVKLYFHLYLADGTIESIPMGVFEVSEANRHIRTLELKAYDYMLRFEKNLVLSITFTAKESTSAMFLGEFLLDVVAEDVEKTIEGIVAYMEEEPSTAEDGTESVITTETEKHVTFDFTERTTLC